MDKQKIWCAWFRRNPTGCLSILLIALTFNGFAQVTSFTMPDTVCEDQPVSFTGVLPVGAATYDWSFCTGNAFYEPDGINLGNPSQLLNAPRFITVVQDSLDYYTFITNTGISSVIRCFHGNSLTQFPTATTNLGGFGILTSELGGIQVKKENGHWYGYVAEGGNLVELDFGNSPGNNPSVRIIGLPGVIKAFGLTMLQQNGTWIGFCTDMSANSLIRLDFTLGLGQNPAVTNLGNIGDLNSPAGLAVALEKGKYYAFICNIGNSTLTRIQFGASILNPAPTGSALATVAGLTLNAGVTIVNDCGSVNGYVTNCVIEADHCIVHLVFLSGLGGPVISYQIENNGVLNKPYGISEVVRQGAVLYAFVANFGSSSITRMFFPSCTESSIPFYSGPDPPPVTYANPGNYNIQLNVDVGLPTQSSFCKNIEVIPKPACNLGPDRTICQGTNNILDAGAGNSSYLWSTGATTRAIVVDTSGHYWVKVGISNNCESADTVFVTVNKPGKSSIDTTICSGQTYWAQHAHQTSSGIYYDTLRMVNGCDSVVVTQLKLKECPLVIWFPNAFTPNGDGLNDYYRPTGTNIIRFTMRIYNRWGAMVFSTDNIKEGWDGMIQGGFATPDVYTYQATFETSLVPGEIHQAAGTLVLTR